MSLALGACVHPHVPPTLVVDRPSCDPALALDEAVPLQFDRGKAVKTDAGLTTLSPCIEAPDGSRDYYAAFVLPPADRPYDLLVGAIPEDISLLAPQVLLLDAAGAVSRRLTTSEFLFRGNQLSLLVRLRPNETRMVVASDHTLVGQAMSRTLEIVVSDSRSFVRYGSEEKAETTFSFVGPLSITVLPAS